MLCILNFKFMKNKIYDGIYTKGPNQQTDSFIVDFAQQQADSEIVPFYLWETLAHNYMLMKQKIVPEKAAKKILKELIYHSENIEKNGFIVDPLIGDVHENFENLLIKSIGDIAGWMHVARSRNDQITTDQKLITKKLLFDLYGQIFNLAKVLEKKVYKYKNVVMPGFTHFRVAMPSSFGFWWQSYLQQIIECEEILKSVFLTTDISSLGAGASYGVNWPIDPKMTANDLGFDKPMINALFALNSRGIHESYVLGPLCSLSVVLSRMMEDIIYFSSAEINFIFVDESFTTGSSIMPQKMNAVVAERTRSKAAKILGNYITTLISLKGTPSGYNMDSAETKTSIIESLKIFIDTINIVAQMLETISPNTAAMGNAVAPSLATKLADCLSQDYQIPFRKTHQIVGKVLQQIDKDISKISSEKLEKIIMEIVGKKITLPKGYLQNILDSENALSQYYYKGSPNPTYVEKVNAELSIQNQQFLNWFKKEQEKFYDAKKNLVSKVKKYLKEK